MHMPYRAAVRAAAPGAPQHLPDDARRPDDLLSPTQIDRLIRRESLRADRTGHEFSVVLFRCPNGHRATGRGGRLRAARLARVLARRARVIDEVGWFDGDHLCAVLPDTGAAGARIFADHVGDLIARRRAPRPRPVIYTYPGGGGRLPAGHTSDESPNGNGHSNGNSHANGNGRANGNGNGNGNGHANGNRLAVPAADTLVLPEARPGLAAAGVTIAREDLVPFVVAGAACAAEPLDALLVRPMPRWKRVIDIVGACVLAVLLAPVLFVTAIAVKLTSRGPVIYKQRRAGLGGRPFVMYKFRSMIDGAEAMQPALRAFNEQDGPAFKMTNDPRLTPIGRFIRKTSIDELPQLWNVLRGEMSLVGPRPLPLDESDGCTQWQRHRLEVTPGLTCLWQVDGRSRVTFAQWVAMDLRYVRARSFWRDLSILLRTVPAVLWRRGAR